MSRSLTFDDVTISYGHGRSAVTAAEGVALTVPAGSVTGLVGESGSGKSTLARAAVGLAPVARGRITLGDVALSDRRSRRAIQMVFQDPYASLNPRMTVGTSINEGLKVNRNPEYSVDDLLEMIRLDPQRRSAYPRSFSGGERQRIALARALAAGPDVLIADEVASALDVSVQGSVINLLMELQRRLGFSVLFISHDLPVVRYVSDRIAVMYQGRLVESGDAQQVLTDPRDDYTRSLLAASAALARPLSPS